MNFLENLILSKKILKRISNRLLKKYNNTEIFIYGIADTDVFRYNILYDTLYCIKEKDSYLLVSLINNTPYLIRLLKEDPSVGFASLPIRLYFDYIQFIHKKGK